MKRALLITIGFLSVRILSADTPRLLNDPEAFVKNHPKLSSQRQWTEFATPEQISLFAGPETQWPVVPQSDYDLAGFDYARLYSKVPPPGIHPRILFSPEDVPIIKKQLESTVSGRQLLAQTDFVLSKTLYDKNSDEGKIFNKLSSGDLSGLEWLIDEKTGFIQHYFKGYKFQGKLTPHAGYLPRLMEAAAFSALIDNNEVRGKELAAAMANYWKLREPLIDKVNADKDSPPDYWRSFHQLVSASNLGLGYDLAAKWMTSEQKKVLRRVIMKATSGKLAYGENGPTPWRDTNWTGWDLTHFLTALSIEGEEGYDPEIRKVASETVRDYLTWGIDPYGVIFETNGKNGAGLLYALSSAVALARRGENYLGNPHLRKLTSAQVQDVVPQGGINVNNGTWGCAPFWGNLASFLKALYPDDKAADWLLRQGRPEIAGVDAEQRKVRGVLADRRVVRHQDRAALVEGDVGRSIERDRAPRRAHEARTLGPVGVEHRDLVGQRERDIEAPEDVVGHAVRRVARREIVELSQIALGRMILDLQLEDAPGREVGREGEAQSPATGRRARGECR